MDVSKEEIADSVEQYRPKVLGLSALLSTTKDGIKEITGELEKRGLRDDVKVIIGGLLIDRRFAKKAGGDAYAEEAIEGVRIIKKWIGEKVS